MTIPELPQPVKDFLLSNLTRYVTAKLTVLAAGGGVWAVVAAPGYAAKIASGAGIVLIAIFDVWHYLATKHNTVAKAKDAEATIIADSQSKA